MIGEPREKGLLAWMARNHVAANLLMLVLVGGGLIVAMDTKQEVFPEYALDIIDVGVSYPGASPEEVEEGITLAIEDEVRSLEGIKEISSSAWEGYRQATHARNACTLKKKHNFTKPTPP